MIEFLLTIDPSIIPYIIFIIIYIIYVMYYEPKLEAARKKEVAKNSTKQCPLCGNDKLVLLRSTYQKGCNNHGDEVYYFPWPLDEGQNSIIGNNRQKKPTEENTNDK